MDFTLCTWMVVLNTLPIRRQVMVRNGSGEGGDKESFTCLMGNTEILSLMLRGPFAKFVDSLYYSELESVEVRWRSLFRSTSLYKRCISYNAPPTSRKRTADRSSLRNFLPQISLFVVRTSAIQFRSRPMKFLGLSNHEAGVPRSKPPVPLSSWSLRQHVFEKWVERCKKCFACKGRYFEKQTVTALRKFQFGLIRWVHELCKQPSYMGMWECYSSCQFVLFNATDSVFKICLAPCWIRNQAVCYIKRLFRCFPEKQLYVT
jgi:hypothetical protein